MEPRTLSARGGRDVGYAEPSGPPCSPSIPRTIEGIEQNQFETENLIDRLEQAIDGPTPTNSNLGPAKSAHEPGILERLGGVNHRSLEIRQRLESLLAKLSK